MDYLGPAVAQCKSKGTLLLDDPGFQDSARPSQCVLGQDTILRVVLVRSVDLSNHVSNDILMGKVAS